MAKINTIIPEQAFELIRNQIGRILADEIANQVLIGGNYDLDATVYIERFIPFQETELPAVNISLQQGDLAGQTAIQSDGTYVFNVDAYTYSKSEGAVDDDPDPSNTTRGDSLAFIKLQRLLGVCRAILDDPRYKTLGFAPPFINNRHVSMIGIQSPPNKGDMANCVMGRIVVSVKAPEVTDLIQPQLIEGYKTTVKLEASEKGYLFLSV
jgi:hypothetical protein